MLKIVKFQAMYKIDTRTDPSILLKNVKFDPRMGVLYATSVKWRLDDNKNPCTNITCRVHIVVRL